MILLIVISWLAGLILTGIFFWHHGNTRKYRYFITGFTLLLAASNLTALYSGDLTTMLFTAFCTGYLSRGLIYFNHRKFK